VPPQLAGFEACVKAGKLVVHYQPSKAAMSDILARIQSAGLTIRDISTKEVELEDLFLKLTAA
jgi:ABC-2 type transport system ATP-binding protein